jgi:hypothetical protein
MNAQHSTLNAQRSSARAVYDLEDRLLEYAVRIIRVAESMKRSAAGVHIADQLGSAPGPRPMAIMERLKAPSREMIAFTNSVSASKNFANHDAG